MKVSIITACYNSAATIGSCIRSVLEQSYSSIEHIIVDGDSSDRTMQIVRDHSDQVATIISEPDDGIYDAINKGIANCTGEVIGLLHSDDIFPNEYVIERIASVFEKEGVDAVYGDLQYVDRLETDQVIRNWRSRIHEPGLFLKGWMPAHPTFYVRKQVYDRFGLYNTAFQISADYEFMLRVIHKHQIRTSYIPEVLVKMRVGGESNTSISNRLRANKEDRLAWKINGLRSGLFTTIRKPLSKLHQWL